METLEKGMGLGPRHKREPIAEVYYALDSVSPRAVHKNFGVETLQARNMTDWGWLRDHKDVQTIWVEMRDHDLDKTPSYVPCTPCEERPNYASKNVIYPEGVEVESLYKLPIKEEEESLVPLENVRGEVSQEGPCHYVYPSEIATVLLNRYFPFPSYKNKY
jgi:hypothetical protein